MGSDKVNLVVIRSITIDRRLVNYIALGVDDSEIGKNQSQGKLKEEELEVVILDII